ncbi:MAG: hypothetical protein NZM04_02525 [Methylacidiphilales bacterium]|nr:hypothetical protein [Candidatus Methylacidiphilales bacterium]
MNNVTVTGTSHAVVGLHQGSYWWQVTAMDYDGDTTQADNGERWLLIVQDDRIGTLNTSGLTGTRKEAKPTAVRMGDAVTYTIVLSNNGSLLATVRERLTR